LQAWLTLAGVFLRTNVDGPAVVQFERYLFSIASSFSLQIRRPKIAEILLPFLIGLVAKDQVRWGAANAIGFIRGMEGMTID
jgi:hypothetical protein